MADNKMNILGGFKKWLYALMGKTPSATHSTPIKQEVAQEQQEPQEDSVANDMKMFKDLVKKGVKETKTILTPFAKKGAATATDTTKAVASSVDNKFIKITVRVFVIGFFTVILVFVASYLFKLIQEENGKPHVSVVHTPTPVSYEPDKPSVYADDPEVLELEEDARILEGELTSSGIRESGINPPQLDWNISF